MNNRLALAAIALAMVAGLIACSAPSTSVAVTGVIVAYKGSTGGGANLNVGGSSKQLVATVAPSNASQTVTWSSSDTSVVTVSGSGLVTGMGIGTATITATAPDGTHSGTYGIQVWQEDGSSNLQYYSKNPGYYGWDWLHYPTQTSLPLSSNPVTATVEQISGSTSEGQGIAFCLQDTNNFYRLLVAANGQYKVDKVIAGTYTTLVDWTSSGFINAQGNLNTLVVTQPSAGQIAISINGNVVTTVTDSTYTGGQVSVFATDGTSTVDSFPATPEDVRFKITAPITYPSPSNFP